jgi:DNA-binding SARP family transcriptional activator
MATRRFQLFGKFTIYRDAESVKGLDGAKEQELLSYLLVRREHCHPREALAALLWGDTSTEKSRKYLRQALWRVQSVLEDGRAGGPPLLSVAHDWVQLNLHTDVTLDVAVLERAYEAARGISGQKLDRSGAEMLKRAIDVYKGDLLAGSYQDWCLFERERLQNIYLSILEKLMIFSKTHGEYEAGQSYGSTILWFDPARESTHRQLMHLYYMAGNRTAALRQYERCARALAEELEVKPQKRTIDLYEQIRADRLDTTTSGEHLIHVSALQDALGRLKRFQDALSTVQHRLQRDIKAVEQDVQARSNLTWRKSSPEN